MEGFAAILAILILFGLSVFQIFLILGYPLGEYAWGGQRKVLNKSLKISSAISIGIYLLMVMILLDSADLIDIYSINFLQKYGIKILAGYFALGTFVNLISRSKKERNIMTPVALTLFVCCMLII